MGTRSIGGVEYPSYEMENYLGQQYIVYVIIDPANLPTLGAPDGPQVSVMSGGVLYTWGGTKWEKFYKDGAPGPANTLTIGTVSTLSSGANATASISGTSPNQVLSLGIPRGSPGANGSNNTLSIGSVTTLASGASATASISGSSPNQTLSLGIPAGPSGASPSPNSLSIGTVTALAAGSSPTASITGSAPSQTLNLGIPAGATGNNGASNTLAIGTISTLPSGASATASITGSSPSQTLNLGIPQGSAGSNGVGVAPGAPAAIAVAFATAYQASDNSKAAHINVMLESNYLTTLAGTSADEVEIRIGSTNAVATGGGNQVATWKTSLTGIALTVGMGIIQRSPVAFMLPAGWYFSVRRLSGTTATIVSTLAQPLG